MSTSERYDVADQGNAPREKLDRDAMRVLAAEGASETTTCTLAGLHYHFKDRMFC